MFVNYWQKHVPKCGGLVSRPLLDMLRAQQLQWALR